MRRSASVPLAALVFFASLGAHAEVSVDPNGAFANTIILGTITEDTDPIGIWLQRRPIPSARVLNADGHARGDGRPDLHWRTSSWPVAVWAYNLGVDHDIAFSEWDGAAWTPTEFLTSSTTDELDPRVTVEPDGTVHVVWWTEGITSEVYLGSRHAGASLWDPPIIVTTGAGEGRRPSVAVVDGLIHVAYERDCEIPGPSQEIVVAIDDGAGGFVHHVIGTTTRTERLDAMVHAKRGHFWVEWKHDDIEFGASEFADSAWTPAGPEPWLDPSWVGTEEARKVVERGVLGP